MWKQGFHSEEQGLHRAADERTGNTTGRKKTARSAVQPAAGGSWRRPFPLLRREGGKEAAARPASAGRPLLLLRG